MITSTVICIADSTIPDCVFNILCMYIIRIFRRKTVCLVSKTVEKKIVDESKASLFDKSSTEKDLLMTTIIHHSFVEKKTSFVQF